MILIVDERVRGEESRKSQKIAEMGRRRIKYFLIFLGLLCLITLTESAALRRRSSPVAIPVGVILDLKSSLGDMALNCTNIGLEDFYSTSEDSYATKLQLHFRHSGHDLLTAASAAWDLIKNKKVSAILGPQNSEQARFIVELGKKSNVPVIWFSPSGPSLLPPRSHFFINSKSTRSHCSQFEAISTIIEAYNWQSVIPIYEDPEFGNDLIPCLSYALQDIATRVPYISAIRQDFKDYQISHELKKIKDKRTYVFIAHMTLELWSRLVKLAQKEGMMSKGYSWVLTQGLYPVIDPKVLDIAVMDGALVVTPSLADSNVTKIDSLERRLKLEYDKTLSLYGLWAYDTITALAYAVENADLANHATVRFRNGSRVDLRYKTGPALFSGIQDTDFAGLSGNFSLRQGQLEPSKVVVYNIVKDQDKKIVGYWIPERGLELSQNHSEIYEVIWSGNTRERPPKLKIGVPKTHFTEFVNASVEGQNISATGFAIDVFKKVVDVLPFPLPYEFVPLYNINGTLTPSSYGDLLCSITNKNVDVDVIIGDITIVLDRTKCVDFTMPYLDSSVSMVVKVRSDSKSRWILLKPFDWLLWLILGVAFVVATVIVLILEKRKDKKPRTIPEEAHPEIERKDDGGGSKFKDFLFNPFLIYTSDVGCLKSGTSKWVVIVVTFLVGLILQVYTANLTSILTERTTAKPPPWKDLQEIKRSNRSVGYQSDSWVKGLLIDQIGLKDYQLKALGSHKEYDEALSKGTKKGGVDAIFDETPYLMLLLSECSSCKMTGPMYKAGGFAFAFSKNSTLVSNFSAAILQVTQNVTMFSYMKESISLPVTIDKSEYKNDIETRSLTKDDFGRLFPVLWSVLALFFTISIIKAKFELSLSGCTRNGFQFWRSSG